MIEFKDISVVVQGRIEKPWTQKSLESIRQHLPGATIILSTWHGETVDCLTGLYDVLVLNDDDVFVFCNEFYVRRTRTKRSVPQNINRQIKSSLAGLQKVTTPYAMKLRSDMIIEGTDFLMALEIFVKRSDDMRIARQRIIVGCHTTRIAKTNTFFRHYKCPFSISDFFCFGLSADLVDLWSAPYYSEEDAFYFKDGDPLFRRKWGYRVKSHMKLLPEQHVWLNFINKHTPVNMKNLFDNSKENIGLYKKFVANNLVVLSQDRLQISLPRDDSVYVNGYFDFTFMYWLCLYTKHCEKNRYKAILLALWSGLVRNYRLLFSLPGIWKTWVKTYAAQYFE